MKALDFMCIKVKEGCANIDNLTRKFLDEYHHYYIFPERFVCLLLGCFAHLSDRLDLFINQDKLYKSNIIANYCELRKK